MRFGRLEGASITTNARRAVALPTASGVLFFALVALLLLGAINFQSNLGFLMAFSFLILGFIAMLMVGQNFHGVEISSHGDLVVQEGVIAQLDLKLRSDLTKHDLQIASNQHPIVTNAEPDGCHVKLLIESLHRGVYEKPLIEIGSQFPIGWIILRCRWRPRGHIFVYPNPCDPATQQKSKGSNQFNEIAVRPYRTGDRMASVSWKKTKTLTSPVVVDSFGNSKSQIISFRNYPNSNYGECLSFLTWEVLRAHQKGLKWSLELPLHRLSARSGSKHLEACLKELARA